MTSEPSRGTEVVFRLPVKCKYCCQLEYEVRSKEITELQIIKEDLFRDTESVSIQIDEPHLVGNKVCFGDEVPASGKN